MKQLSTGVHGVRDRGQVVVEVTVGDRIEQRPLRLGSFAVSCALAHSIRMIARAPD